MEIDTKRSGGSSGRRVGVSVLMAVKNGARHLRPAVDTLLAQTYGDFELIVVDDGSEDETPALLARYAKQDPRVRILRQDVNQGLPKSLNLGLEHCRAPLVARADADDVYAPHRLETQVGYLERHPEVGVLGCGFRRMREDGTPISTVVPPPDHERIRARQIFMNSLLHPGVVFRTHVVRAVGGYDERYWTAQDSDLWARLRDLTRFANVPDPLVDYRVSASSIVGARGERGRALSIEVPRRLLSALLGRPLAEADAAAAITLYQGFEDMPSADIRRALPILREALRRSAAVESRRTVAFLRREAAISCVRQLGRHVWKDRPTARRLLATAAALAPSAVAARPSTLRALLPRQGG